MKLTITILLFLGRVWFTNAGYPRLHFSGNFLADTPTLNNDPENFNIHNFNASRNPPCYINYTYPHCNWNPTGSGDFRFVNCFVTKVCNKAGMCSKYDAVVGKRIIGSDDTVAAKISDLDVYHQLTTAQLWGLVVGVEGAFQGNFKTNTVMDIWQRCHKNECPGDPRPGRSGYFSSVLTNVTWMDDVTDSRFLRQLRYYEHDNSVLNIKFTVDFMHEDATKPNFTLGRVVGTISAVDRSPGCIPEFNRMMWSHGTQWLSPDQHKGEDEFYNAPFYVDDVNKKVIVDLSNSLPTNLEGELLDLGNLSLVVFRNMSALKIVGGKIADCTTLLAQPSFNLGRISPLALRNPLMIVREDPEPTSCQECPKQCTPVLVEHLDGLYVGPAEDRVFRIPQPKTGRPLPKPDTEEDDNDGKVCWSLTLFAAQFGVPKAGVSLSIQRQDVPNTGQPADAIEIFPGDCRGNSKAKTNVYGVGAFRFLSDKEGIDRSVLPAYRKYIDGQVYIYKVRLSDDKSFPPGLWTSTHLYGKLDKKSNYSWSEDIYPVLKMYGNLYPVMDPLFNLSSEEDVRYKLSEVLSYALSLPIENPIHMPVTRDLSPARRDMILDWLKQDTIGESPSPSLEIQMSLRDIKQNLHTALQLEWTTIPPYLSAYYSIKEGYNNNISEILRSVVVEEMFHMSLVSNILNFLGESPILNDPNLLPNYPESLPGGVMPNLTVGLSKFSLDVTHEVFMGIETPECHEGILEVHKLLREMPCQVIPIDVPKQCINKETNCDTLCENVMQKCNESVKDFNNATIGAVYIHKILCPIVRLYISNPEVFSPKEDNLKKQVPLPFCVLDICSVIDAIKYIVGEGEGSDPCNPFFEGEGTTEVSHYYKFKEIWKGRRLKEVANKTGEGDGDGGSPDNTYPEDCPTGDCDIISADQSTDMDGFIPCGNVTCPKKYTFSGDEITFDEDGVWPTVFNPKTLLYHPGSRVRILSDSFNQKYTSLMNCLHETYNGNPGLLIQCHALMTSLTVDAKRLVQTPIPQQGGLHGRTDLRVVPAGRKQLSKTTTADFGSNPQWNTCSMANGRWNGYSLDRTWNGLSLDETTRSP
ncbi:hypothetical protein Bbelb_074680 [Branchiostoma belcheri]|nr:hypothetical protein Bbelb_074680 [Branchiostoma belcheri]